MCASAFVASHIIYHTARSLRAFPSPLLVRSFIFFVTFDDRLQRQQEQQGQRQCWARQSPTGSFPFSLLGHRTSFASKRREGSAADRQSMLGLVSYAAVLGALSLTPLVMESSAVRVMNRDDVICLLCVAVVYRSIRQEIAGRSSVPYALGREWKELHSCQMETEVVIPWLSCILSMVVTVRVGRWYEPRTALRHHEMSPRMATPHFFLKNGVDVTWCASFASTKVAPIANKPHCLNVLTRYKHEKMPLQ